MPTIQYKLNTVPGNLCYKTSGGIVSIPIPANGEIGPLSGGNELMISPAPCGSNPSCFKMIYLPKPNCNDPNIEESQGRVKASANDFNIKIVPNPFSNNQLTLKSDIIIDHDVMFSIYNNKGQMIQSGKFSGHDQTVPFDQPSGLYIIKFNDHTGNVQNYKFIKL